MKWKMSAAIVAALWFCGMSAPAAEQPRVEIKDLRCEYLNAPLGIDVPRPRLSWRIESSRRGERQTAYQVVVDGVWDSGKVTSDQSIGVEYDGKPLESRQRCEWKVRVWDGDGKVSDWSKPASWAMGLLDPAGWKGRWIAAEAPSAAKLAGKSRPMPLFRKVFTVSKPLARAELFTCGLGAMEVHLNGAVADDAVFEPGWTLYSKTCLYRTLDLTDRLTPGSNVLGVMLGNGMYGAKTGRYAKFGGSFGPPKLIAQLHLDYTDGSHEIIASDATWLTAPGPITFSSVYGGEDYNACLERPGWDTAGFQPNADWKAATETDGPGGKLTGSSQSAPPVKVAQILSTVSKTRLKPGSWLYDLGQNCSVMPRISVRGPAGAKITIFTGERFEDGQFIGRCDKMMSFNYTLRGDPAGETWSPRFCYAGARYLQIDGGEAEGTAADAGTPTILNVEGRFVCGSASPAGEFRCSNETYNRIVGIILWAIRSNMMSILTDCPHREKLGWLEQVHLVGPSLMYSYDMSGIMAKMVGDMSDSQEPGGLVPDIAPEYVKFSGGFRDSPEWGSAYVLVPWNLYRWYGDLRILRRHYEGMARFVAYLSGKSNGHLLSYGLADWYGLDRTSQQSTATAFYYADLLVMEQTARLLGKADDAANYSKLAAEVRQAYNAQLLKGNSYGSQTANALPLAMGITAEDKRAAVLEAIVADIRKRKNSLTAGDVGYRYLLRALADNGRSDVIFDMNSRSDRPGYGMILAKGNTSLTEPWDGSARSSSNHFMLGHIQEWFYADLAGIQCGDSVPAWRKIVIKPQVVGDLTWVKAHYDSPYGRIAVDWEKQAAEFKLNIAIPANTTATVYIPAKDAAEVTEGTTRADQANGVKLLRMEKDTAVYEVGSGTYRFCSKR